MRSLLKDGSASTRLATADIEMGDAESIPLILFQLFNIPSALIRACLSASAYSEKNILLSLKPEDGVIKINFFDTGPGIPKHALKKVFDIFFRVDNELTRITGGTGIGLALVYKFVKAMAGKMEAKNNKGAGCTISLYLPIKKA